MQKNKASKQQKVVNHLKKKGTITSWQAIELYGATRLAAIIHTMRKKGHEIHTKNVNAKDRFGNNCTYAKYVFVK
jgi:hypothetical protein